MPDGGDGRFDIDDADDDESLACRLLVKLPRKETPTADALAMYVQQLQSSSSSTSRHVVMVNVSARPISEPASWCLLCVLCDGTAIKIGW
jgi:hypothetical protein